MGYIDGAAFLGNVACTASMKGIIYYFFEVVKYRKVYLPWVTMKNVISDQKLEEKASVFYA